MALWHIKVALMYMAAWLWRRILLRTTFVAITGSMGKTTAKECLAAALVSRFPTAKTHGNQNDYSGVPRSLLRVRPWQRFAVIEVATSRPGLMRRSARLIRPHVAIVLNVARSHMKGFRTLEAIAAEKAQLVAALAPGGTALLNGDDALVAAMAQRPGQRVVRFGTSASFPYWLASASSNWPEHFGFELHAGEGHCRVQTRLVGTHWKDSVAAALAAAHICGVPLAEAADAIGRIDPVPGRMQPAAVPRGATVIRDEFHGSIDTLGHALQVLREASAARKILVISDVTDTSASPRDRLNKIGREAARIADLVVFIGDHASHGVKGALAAGVSGRSARGFATWEAAAEFLQAELRSGDLALLRGRGTDHLSRIYFAQIGTVGCHRTRCEKTIICDLCPQLRTRYEDPSDGRATAQRAHSRGEA